MADATILKRDRTNKERQDLTLLIAFFLHTLARKKQMLYYSKMLQRIHRDTGVVNIASRIAAFQIALQLVSKNDISSPLYVLRRFY